MSTTLPPDIDRVLIDASAIQQRVAELAAQIDQDYRDSGQLLLVGVLKGAFIFLADLACHMTIPHTVDFMAVSSYGMTASSGAVRIVLDLRVPIAGQHVLLVEDIVELRQYAGLSARCAVQPSARLAAHLRAHVEGWLGRSP